MVRRVFDCGRAFVDECEHGLLNQSDLCTFDFDLHSHGLSDHVARRNVAGPGYDFTLEIVGAAGRGIDFEFIFLKSVKQFHDWHTRRPTIGSTCFWMILGQKRVGVDSE